MHWRHCLGKSTRQKAATSSSPQCRHPEGGSARGRRRTPHHDVVASNKSAVHRPPPACIQRWCHHSSSPSQAKVHEATSPATSKHKNNQCQSLWLIAKKNVLRMHILRTKSTHIIAQSFCVSSKNRSMAIKKHLLSCNNNSNTIRKINSSWPTNFQADSHTVPAQGSLDLRLVQEILDAHSALPGKLAVLWCEEGRILKAPQRIDEWMDR